MSLKTAFRSALDGLPSLAASEFISVSEGVLQLDCELVALDKLGCAFQELRFIDPALQAASVETLGRVAQGLSERLNYLLEPIRPVEIDSERCIVQLRSNPPQQEAGQTCYYELLVTRQGYVSLIRWCKSAGNPRVQVAAQVTREVLIRLAGDLSQSTATSN
jgi:hypothetical protein